MGARTLAGSAACCNDSNYLRSHINISLLTVWLAQLVEGCKSQHNSDVAIRSKLHIITLFPAVSREAERRVCEKEGGTFVENGWCGGGDKEVPLQQWGGVSQHTCLTFRLVLLHKYFSRWWGLKGATKCIYNQVWWYLLSFQLYTPEYELTTPALVKDFKSLQLLYHFFFN